MTKLFCSGLALFTLSCGGSSPEPAEPAPAENGPPQEAADDSWQDEPAVGAEEPQASASPDEAPGPAVGSEEDEKPLGATVEETRTTEVIRGVVDKNRDVVRRCFDALSTEEKGSGGTLTISFKLDPKGSVTSAGVNDERSTLKQPKLVTCAADAIKAMKFPASSRGFESSVNYPFNFKP